MARNDFIKIDLKINRKEYDKLIKDSEKHIKKLRKDFQSLGTDASKSFNTAFKSVNTGFSKVNKKVKSDFNKTTKSMTKSGKRWAHTLREAWNATFGGFFSSIGGGFRRMLTRMVRDGVTAFKQLDKGAREIMTLLSPQQIEDMGGIEAIKQMGKELAVQFGQEIPKALKATYNALSASIPQEALAKTMEQAGKLAVGGLTELDTAIDGIAASYNAYKKSVDDVEAVTDTFFIGMKNGITTVDELVKNIGKVAPIASSMNVSFEESIAAMSALTTQKIKTAQASTYLQGTIKGILKPSASAQKVMEELGIAYGDAALKNQTLQQWLETTREKLDNSGKSFKDVFGNVRAYNGAVVLAGTASEKFKNILKDMDDAAQNAGATTNAAFEQMEMSVEMKLKRTQQRIQNTFIDLFERLYPTIERLIPLVESLLPIIENIGVVIQGIIDNPLFKFGIDVIKGISNEIAGMVAPTRTAINNFNELGKSIQDSEKNLKTLSKISFSEKILSDSAELKTKIDAVREVAPDLADKLQAIADGSDTTAGKIRRMNEALAETRAEIDKMTYRDKLSAIDEFYTASAEVAKSYDKTQREIAKLEGQYDTLSDKEKNKLDVLKQDLKAYEAQFKSLVENSKITEIFSPDELRKQLNIVEKEYQDAAKVSSSNTLMGDFMSEDRVKKTSTTKSLLFDILNTTEKQSEANKTVLSTQEQINAMKNGEIAITDEQAEKIKKQLDFMENMHKKIQDTPLAKMYEDTGKHIQQMKTDLAGVVEEHKKLKTQAETEAEPQTPTEDLSGAFTGITGTIVNVEQAKKGLERIEAEYQVYLDRIKALGLENKEEENALLVDLERKKQETIQAMFFDSEYLDKLTGQVQQEIQNITQDTDLSYEAKKRQLDTILERERQRLELLRQQAAEQRRQLETQIQMKLQELIAAEKSGDLTAEQRTALEREIELLRETIKSVDASVKAQENLVASIDNSIDKAKQVTTDTKTVDKERRREEARWREEQLREERRREEERKRAEEERRRKEEELARQREERIKSAYDYLSRQETESNPLIADIKQATEDFKEVYGETAEEIRQLDFETRQKLLDSLEEQKEEIVNTWQVDVEMGLRNMSLDTVDSVNKAFDLVGDAQQTISELKDSLGSEIPASMKRALDRFGDDLWVVLSNKLSEALKEQRGDLILEHGGVAYQDVIAEKKKKNIEQSIEEDFNTYDQTLKNQLKALDRVDPIKKYGSEISDELDELNKEYEETGNQLDELNSKIELNNRELQEYNRKVEEHKNLIQEVADIEEQIEEQKKKIRNTKSDIWSKDSELYDLQQREEEIPDEIAALQNIVGQLEDGAELRFDEYGRYNVGTQTGVETLDYLTLYDTASKEELIGELKTVISSKKGEAGTIKEKIPNTKEALKEAEEELETLKEDLTKLEGELETKRRERDRAKKSIPEKPELDKETEKELNRLTEKQTELKGEIADEEKRIEEEANKRLKAEKKTIEAQILEKDIIIEIAQQRALAAHKLESQYEERKNQLNNEYKQLQLNGATEEELLRKRLQNTRELIQERKNIADQHARELKMIIAKTDSEEIRKRLQKELNSIEADTIDLELHTKAILEQLSAIQQERLRKTIELVQTFAENLAQAFKDGEISAEEFMQAMDTLIEQGVRAIGTAVGGQIGGEVASSIYTVVKGIISGIGSLFADTSHTDALYEQKGVHTSINSILEARTNIMESLIALNDSSLDTAKEQLEYQKETVRQLEQQMDIQDPEQAIQELEALLEKQSELREAINALESDAADDNFLEDIGNWFAGLAGASKEDKLEQLQAELESINMQIDSTEELISLYEQLNELEKQNIDEKYQKLQLQAELNYNEIGLIDAQINRIKELIARQEELGLTDLELLELQKELSDLYEKRWEASIKAYEEEAELAIKKAKLAGASEEEIEEMRLKKIEELIKAKQEEIDTLGYSVERETELVDLQLERMEIQKAINGELQEEGQIMNDNVRAVLRQVIEARKLGNIMLENQAISEAIKQLEAQGLSAEEISELLNVNITDSDMTTTTELPDIGDFETTTIQKPEFETQVEDDMTEIINSSEEQTELMSEQIQELHNQNDLLKDIRDKEINITIPEGATTFGSSSSDVQRFLDKVNQTNRG